LWLNRKEFSYLQENAKLTSIERVAITFASSGALSWFFVIVLHFDFLFQNVTNNQFWIFLGLVLFYGFGALSAFVGVYIQKKITRKSLLFWSTTLGLLATGALAVFQGEIFAIIFGILLGISFGIGFPSGAALFADCTEVENRGKTAGILVLMTFVLISLEMILAEFFSLIGIIIIIMLLRSTSYLAIIKYPYRKKEERKELSYITILTRKNIALYLIPWVLFNLVSGLSNFIYPGLPQTEEFAAALEIGNLLQFLGLAAVSLISGYMSDRFGRKPPIIIGVVTFGVSFAIFGLATNTLSLIIQLTVHGIAWGFCMVAYFAIPGDLAANYSQEKFYATNTVLPFISYMATGTLPAILGVSAEASILSPILSILLFLSVVPILYAKETLPEKKMRERELKKHLEKLSKVVAESEKE